MPPCRYSGVRQTRPRTAGRWRPPEQLAIAAAEARDRASSMVNSTIDCSASDWRSPVVRCVIGSKLRIFSTSSPNMSSRTGSSKPGGNRSTMPPRTAYSRPPARSRPGVAILSEEHCSTSISARCRRDRRTPTAAACRATARRCATALMVVSTRRAFPGIQQAGGAPAMRWPTISTLGDNPVIGQGNPKPGS